LGGAGVGLGYVNAPELTAEAFRSDPIEPASGATLYKTGDLVIECPSTGLLSFKGRIDNQVKIRGHRVELEEIDHAVAAFENISRALTVVYEDVNGMTGVVAAYVADALIDEEALEENCRRKLPRYMVPERFVRLDEMPTIPNGKADRRAVKRIIEASLG
jgi:D-alanine--poly(phosphoribitol) ligase subunit 1